MNVWTGPWGAVSAAGLGVASYLCIYVGLRGAAVAAAAHNLGLTLTLVFGILSATWWRQAAVLSNRAADVADAGVSDPAVARDSNILNAAAATSTGLGIIAGGFISTPWNSRSAWTCAAAFLLVLTLFGGDLHEAVAISSREHLRRRSLVALGLVATALLLFATNRTAV